ncbi:MAG: hypothetical protein HZB39_20875 [Planctomycetes bacterium]|nr:hypothetical protein [Planctomycetota bacterium]
MSNAPARKPEPPPALIPMGHSVPVRREFSFPTFDPRKVAFATDLPPYLILGGLDETSFHLRPDGWSACWVGLEAGTKFAIDYDAGAHRYSIQQHWCALEGPYSVVSAELSLARALSHFVGLCSDPLWGRTAKRHLEQAYHLEYFLPEGNAVTFFGIPDGDHRTLVLPIAVDQLRRTRAMLSSMFVEERPPYAIHVEARLVTEAINHIEGKAPDWTRGFEAVLRSLDETGLFPSGLPVREAAEDGTAAWTLRRPLYVLCITMPFAGVLDVLHRLRDPRTRIRRREDGPLALEHQPFVVPTGLLYQEPTITRWDEERTTRRVLVLKDPHRRDANALSLDRRIGEVEIEKLVCDAEWVSRDVIKTISHGLSGAGGSR